LRNSFKLDFGARAGKLFVLCLHFCLINFTKRQRKWCPCTSKEDKETEDRIGQDSGLGDSETVRDCGDCHRVLLLSKFMTLLLAISCWQHWQNVNATADVVEKEMRGWRLEGVAKRIVAGSHIISQFGG